MRFICAMALVLMAGFAQAEDPTTTPATAPVAVEEQSDFELLTTLPQVELNDIRGERWSGIRGLGGGKWNRGLDGCGPVTPATPQEQVAAMRSAILDFLTHFQHGDIGTLTVGANGAVVYTHPGGGPQ